MKNVILLNLIVLFCLSTQARPKEYDLKNFPKGQTPKEIGSRIAEKFLNTAHSRYGNTHPETPPTQITYPDVCTWLGGMWFAEVTHNDQLFNRFESRFTPLFAIPAAGIANWCDAFWRVSSSAIRR